MSRRAVEDRALVEDPVHRTVDQPHKAVLDDRSVEPEIDGHDWRAGHIDSRARDVRQASRYPAPPQRTERVPGHRADHGRRGNIFAARIDAFHDTLAPDEDVCRSSREYTPAVLLDETDRRNAEEFVERHRRNGN